MALHDNDQRLVLGRYRIGGLLGRGGASHVHRAHDVQTGRDVAVKILPESHQGMKGSENTLLDFIG